MESVAAVDVLVIGSGPAGQAAALEARAQGMSVMLIEREPVVGGACLHRGTIPSKALREAALEAVRARRSRADGNTPTGIEAGTVELAPLLFRVEGVLAAHTRTIGAELAAAGVSVRKGRAKLTGPHTVAVESVRRDFFHVRAELIVLAVGSSPRQPPGVPIDHEHILDSDSLLSMTYLPESLAVIGGGIIACEYASIFAYLGTRVTVVDPAPEPMRFLDTAIIDRFITAFRQTGGAYITGRKAVSMAWNGLSQVNVQLDDGRQVAAEKVLIAAGRTANVADLGLDALGIQPTSRGHLQVDACFRTAVPHILAVGDVAGPPALASAAALQGRLAIRRARGDERGQLGTLLPAGIYTIPEISAVGQTAEDLAKAGRVAVTAEVRFDETSRGLISGIDDGLLKLVVDAEDRRVVGVHIVGDGATELVHIGQMAIAAGATVDVFSETIFNYPTLAECYRLAALRAQAALESVTRQAIAV